MTPKGYLLDTNVLSELLRKRPDPRVARRVHAAPVARLKVSAMSIVELRAGAARVHDGARLWSRIKEDLLSRVEVLGIRAIEAEAAGDFLALLTARGEPIGLPDALIAATAAVNDLVVVTRNLRHFSRLPITVESWWS